MRCPHCGGLNPRDAQWCGQCLTSFAVEPVLAGRSVGTADSRQGGSALAPPPPGPGPVGLQTPTPAVAAGGSIGNERASEVDGLPGNFKVTEGGITWICRMCETENPLAASTCLVCTSSFAQTLREPDEGVIKRDPGTVTLMSLFFPGAGHAYLGLWPQAIARGMIAALVVLVTILGAVAPGSSSKPLATVFFMVSFGWWALSAHDAYREATGRRYAVILKDRGFLFAVLGILLLLTAMVVVTLAGAR